MKSFGMVVVLQIFSTRYNYCILDLIGGIRMLVGTWNVGGKPPNEGLNLRDWLNSPTPIDIYVIGYALFSSSFFISLSSSN